MVEDRKKSSDNETGRPKHTTNSSQSTIAVTDWSHFPSSPASTYQRHSISSDHDTIQEVPEEEYKGSSEAPQEPSTTITRQISRLSSKIKTKYPAKVPRNQRRGLFARFALIPEVHDPYAYPRRTKWLLTFVIALAAVAGPMGSAIVMPVLGPIAEDFGAEKTVTNLSVALYMLSMSIFPLWWSSFSETLGRRTIYLTSFVMFTFFAVLSAVAKSITMLIVMRVLSGGAAASVQAVGAGTIADMWESGERGRAMGIFYIGPLMGPLLGPIIGGVLAQGFNWRATQWFTAIYGLVVSVLLFFGLPETLHARKTITAEAREDANATMESEVAATGEAGGADPEKAAPLTLRHTVTRQSVAKHSKRTVKLLKRFFLDPLKIILLLRFPAVLITVYYASIAFGSLYFLNISVEDTFGRDPYNFSVLVIGLLYIPNSLGYLLASLFGGRWLDHIMKREARTAGRYDEHGELIFRPEDRMKENAWMAAVMFPCALILYGWTAQQGVHWIVPMIANFFFGLGSMIVFAMVTTMLTEFLPKQASTGIAVNNFMRNIFSSIGGVVAHPIIDAIGNGWMFTILGVVSLVSGIAVILTMKRCGPRWREEMERKLEGDDD